MAARNHLCAVKKNFGKFYSPEEHTKRMAAPPMGRLTEEQRKAVVDSWALVEPDATEHGLKFFQQ